jgi:hypothetical protein
LDSAAGSPRSHLSHTEHKLAESCKAIALRINNPQKFDEEFEGEPAKAVRDGAGGLAVGADPFFRARGGSIVALDAKHKLSRRYILCGPTWRRADWRAMAPTSSRCIARSESMRVGFSRGPNLTNFRWSFRENGTLSSTLRPQRRSSLPFHLVNCPRQRNHRIRYGVGVGHLPIMPNNPAFRNPKGGMKKTGSFDPGALIPPLFSFCSERMHSRAGAGRPPPSLSDPRLALRPRHTRKDLYWPRHPEATI